MLKDCYNNQIKTGLQVKVYQNQQLALIYYQIWI